MLVTRFRKLSAIVFVCSILLILNVSQIMPENHFVQVTESIERGNTTNSDNIPPVNPKTSLQSNDPEYAFPGEIMNISYFLGAEEPNVSYYEVTVTLNNSAYVSLDLLPTLADLVNGSGYYLEFSFIMPNDQPGNWWYLGYQIIEMKNVTVHVESNELLNASGTQIATFPSTVTAYEGFTGVVGEAKFPSSQNTTSVVLFPVSPPGVNIISATTNYWRYSNGSLIVNFTLYEKVLSGTSSTPTSIAASITTYISQVLVIPETLGYYSERAQVYLVQGNGAFIMGITSNQIAQIEAGIDATLSVPLSQLDASVTSINNDTAKISTTFGRMNSSLTSINASIKSINNGMATVSTSLGEVETSLNSLNASVISIQGETIMISTSLGRFQTTLSSVNSSLISISGNIAEVDDSLGTQYTTLSSINASLLSIVGNNAFLDSELGKFNCSLADINGTLKSINGNNATVMTTLGQISDSLANLNVTVSSLSSNVSKLNGSLVDVRTSIENLSGQITNVSNSTATIKTGIGTMYASISSIQLGVHKESNSTDPSFPYELLVVLLILVSIAISYLSLSKVNGIVSGLEGTKKEGKKEK